MSSNTDYSGVGTAKDLVPGTLRGYRAWGMDALSDLLSVSMPYRWKPLSNPPAAICCMRLSMEPFLKEDMRLVAHPSPVLGCSCGYYATYTLQDLNTFQAWANLTSAGYVIGTVKAYGSVVLGTIGFRAEYMVIEALVNTNSFVVEKARRYQAALVSSFDELVTRYPPSDVTELLA